MSRSTRIYPIPVKPPSGIWGWPAWPDDVRDIIWRWNKSHEVGLSFVRSSATFKCVDCGEFCVAHPNGAAVFKAHSSTEHQEWSCDDCLIARARAFRPVITHFGEHRRAGYQHHGCTCSSGWTKDEHPIREDCLYHWLAAKFPLDHSIPWNCGSYWDGCNCTRPRKLR